MHPENANTGASEPRDLPPLDLLRTFEAAARTLSFTRAAAELSLTQSAVSRQIQQLEARLGVLLFERRHRALALTAAGGVMQRAVVDSLQRLRDATALVRAAPAVRQVALTCTPGFATLWLIPRLARFTAAHPQVDVRVSATLEVLDLERARLDLAVRFAPQARAIGPALFEERVTPMCAPSVAAQLAGPGDLAAQTLLTIDSHEHGEAATVDWQPWLKAAGLQELRMRSTLRFTHYTDAVTAAVAGHGVVIGRLPLLRDLARDGRLVAPFGEGAPSHRAYYIETSRRGEHNPDARDFVHWMRAEAEGTRT